MLQKMSKTKNMSICLKNDQIIFLKKYLKKRITPAETKYSQFIQKRLHVLDLVKSTVDMGESNSILLIGPRGSGKSTLINSVFKELACTRNLQGNIVTVNLHGSIHTDDRLALKDATRQMQLENVVNGKVFGTFAENLNFLIESLKSGDKRHSKPIIFILDEFDLFCAHHNQTLLYNLFDITQSAQAPVCVIGISCRLDVIELLEKRVKSRFSHRQIFLHPSENSKLETPMPAFYNRLNLFEDLLNLPNDKDVDNMGQINSGYYLNSEFRAQWNEQITALRNHPHITNLLKQMHSIDKCERIFRNLLTIVISMVHIHHQGLTVNDFAYATRIFSVNEKIFILEGLSILEMCLVVAMKHETEICDGESLNFEKVWSRYFGFANRNSSIKTVQRPVVMKAFEHIKGVELITPIGSNQGIEKEYQSYKFTLTSQQVMEAVRNCHTLPTDVTRWADCSLI